MPSNSPVGDSGLLTAGQPKRRFDEARSRALADEYAAGATLAELARRHRATSATVRDAIKRAGGTITPTWPRSAKAKPERGECRCGCGRLVRRPGLRYLHGHHMRRERRERAESVEVVPADAAETCQYRPQAAPQTSGLREPACGRPVRFAGQRFCPEHDTASDHFTDEMRAHALHAEFTQACARCGESWPANARHATRTWAEHTARCEAAPSD